MKKIFFDQLTEIDDFFSPPDMEELPLVGRIISNIKSEGDTALRGYTYLFDKVRIKNFEVEQAQLNAAGVQISFDQKNIIEKIVNNLKKFANKQLESLKDLEYEVEPGVYAGQRVIPISKVGVYVPGGRYPLISSLLMGVIPAKIAGVQEIFVCSPPDKKGELHPAILAAAKISGVNRVFKAGGAQAIAAMAYGTESIPKVNKIIGPGNKYVMAAKKMVYGTIGIDFLAGPTEILIIADRSARADILAADLIAQAEHDPDACPILVTDSLKLADQVDKEINIQRQKLSTTLTIETSLRNNGKIIIVNKLQQAITIANQKAPEHLVVNIKNPQKILKDLKNFGSLFIGEWSTEVLGDYCCGINHILPTSGSSLYSGGLSVRDFLKVQTTLRVTSEGFKRVGPVAKAMAKTEGLEGHAASISIRDR